jgi:hypothetical protein
VLDGSPVDVSDIAQEFNQIHTGTATRIIITVNSTAYVKGTLTADFNTSSSGYTPEELTVKTRADYAYDAVSLTGGAASYSDFTGGGEAEETAISLTGEGGGETTSIEASCSTVIADGSVNDLTILFDLSRVLRFYDGCKSSGGGVNPPDPTGKAYFFAHSLMGAFMAPFFGTPGRIEGYRAFYSADSSPGNGEGVYGWLTLVFDGDGNFLKGMIIGDDDNALTVAKGWVEAYTDGADPGTYDFTYDIAEGTVHGFAPVETQDYYTPLLDFETEDPLCTKTGEAYFQLQFVME